MASQLQNIFDALKSIQEAITPPTGLKAIKATDEPPANLGTFPTFLNLEEESRPDNLAHGHLQVAHTIGMHLLFGRADLKYSVRERRLWVETVLAAFDATDAQTLNNTVRKIAKITSVDYAAFSWPGGDSEYIAANFTLEVETERPA